VIGLLTVLYRNLDFFKIARFVHERRDRLHAARLHLVLVQSYEILELYSVLLEELHAALESHTATAEGHKFYLNVPHLSSLLARQASNISIMESLTVDLLSELRVLDNEFVETYRSIIPGKGSILFEAEVLLSSSRLPLAATGPGEFPASADGSYRTLWLTDVKPQEDRRQIEKYLYGYDGQDRVVVDVRPDDGDIFFEELGRYFREQDPQKQLQELRVLTEQYKQALMETFTAADLLADIGKVRRYYSRLP
jgi:hypothetical protein